MEDERHAACSAAVIPSAMFPRSADQRNDAISRRNEKPISESVGVLERERREGRINWLHAVTLGSRLRSRNQAPSTAVQGQAPYLMFEHRDGDTLRGGFHFASRPHPHQMESVHAQLPHGKLPLISLSRGKHPPNRHFHYHPLLLTSKSVRSLGKLPLF